MAATAVRRADARVWVALGLVYVVWGSTYLAMRVAVRTVPPLLGMGFRYVLAGALVAVFLLVRGRAGRLRIDRRTLAGTALVAALLIFGGNGLVAVSVQTLPSGLAALLVAAVPLWLILFRFASGSRPAVATVSGAVVGFAGLVILAGRGVSGDVAWWGVLVVACATFLWSVGAFIAPRMSMPRDGVASTAWQMLLGGLVLLAASLIAGEWAGFSPGQIDAAGWWALAYLVVFGSLVGYSAFAYALKHAPVSLASTYAYVNPVVAVLLGTLLLDEPLTAAILVGGAIALLGVALVIAGEGTGSAPSAPKGVGRLDPSSAHGGDDPRDEPGDQTQQRG